MSASGANQHNISGWGTYNDWDPVWIKSTPSPPPAQEQLPTPVVLATPGPGCSPAPAEYVGKILFKSDREGTPGIFMLDPANGSVCRVDDVNAGFYYADALQRDRQSPDGRYRLYVRQVGGDFQIWQQDSVTGAIAYVTGGTPGADYDPAWSPDGRLVTYVSQVDGNDEIHLFDRFTGTDTRLTHNSWEWDKHPSFSPDGSQIVFWSNREGGWKHIWVMTAGGTEVHNVSGWGRYNDWDPVWVKAQPAPPPPLPELKLLPLPTPRPVQVLPREWYVGKILFKSDRDGAEAIYAVNPDGSGLQPITDPNVGYYYAEALQRDITSPDGRYRLYVRQVGGDFQIWQQDSVTGAIAYVTGGTPGADYDPAWAPDTRWVAYVSQVDGNDEIHLFDRLTGTDTRLTHNSWEWDKHPSFSPDGSQIVFWSNREGGWKHIWLMSASGANQHNISGWGTYNDWDPVWIKSTPSPPPAQEGGGPLG
jgi:Tol biopolymer transport system component